MAKVNTARNLKTRPITTGDAMAAKVAVRAVSNTRRRHLIKGVRGITHIAEAKWDKLVTEQLRAVEKQRFECRNRFYEALQRSQVLLDEVHRREQELETSLEELKTNYEELEAATEELQATTEELEHVSAYTRSLLEASLDPLVVISPKGKITDVNRATESITGYSRGELIGTDFSNYFTEPAKVRAGYGEAFRKGSVQNYALEIQHRDGRVTPVLCNASVYRDQAGNALGVFASARDITQTKRMQEALLRSNQELEQFAYVASHDLQEPLRMVTSYTQLLAKRYKGKLDADADEFIGYAVDGVTRMQKLINDLLAFSRVSTGGGEFQPTNCETVLSRALANLKMAIEESGAVVTCDALPTVRADTTQLGQVFQNLIGNALKFRSQEPPQIHISAEKKEGEWLFSVRDNGIGIDAKDHERIFLIFQRLHGREYPGTGIGLSMPKKIIERHGGRIWVESELGKGATFYFTIPTEEVTNHGS